MSIEELMELSAEELREKANALGLEYKSRATKADLSELIYAETTKVTDPESAENVALASPADSEELELGNGVFIIPNQMVAVEIRQEDGSLKAGEVAFDDLFAGQVELSVDRVDALEKENAALKHRNAELEALAYREVIGHPSQAPEETVLEWNGRDNMTIRARVKPNCGISSRIRGGHDFTLQYRVITVNKVLFDLLRNDPYIQIDAVERHDK